MLAPTLNDLLTEWSVFVTVQTHLCPRGTRTAGLCDSCVSARGRGKAATTGRTKRFLAGRFSARPPHLNGYAFFIEYEVLILYVYKVKIMESNVESILQNLQSPDPDTREFALDALGSTKPDNAFLLVLPFLFDPEPTVRESAMVNLGELGDERAIPYLLNSAYHETNEGVRMYAIEALSPYHSPDILRFLLTEACRKSSMRPIRQSLARQLANYPTEEAVDALIPMLKDTDPYVRIFAADSLVILNRARLDPVWVDTLLHSDYYHSYIVHVATQALAALRGIEPFDLLSAWLVDAQANVREAAVFACAVLDDIHIIPLLLERAAIDPVMDVRDMALYALAKYGITHIS